MSIFISFHLQENWSLETVYIKFMFPAKGMSQGKNRRQLNSHVANSYIDRAKTYIIPLYQAATTVYLFVNAKILFYYNYSVSITFITNIN